MIKTIRTRIMSALIRRWLRVDRDAKYNIEGILEEDHKASYVVFSYHVPSEACCELTPDEGFIMPGPSREHYGATKVKRTGGEAGGCYVRF